MNKHFLEIHNDQPEEWISSPYPNKPILIVKDTLFIFTLNDELTDFLINDIMESNLVEEIFVYNIDFYNDNYTDFQKQLEKLFFYIIFKNQNYVNKFYILNYIEEMQNVTNTQIELSKRKITKNNGEYFPNENTSKLVKSIEGCISFSGNTIYETYFSETSISEKDIEVETVLDYVPDGYPEYGESSTGIPTKLVYKQIDTYHHKYLNMPITKNVTDFFQSFINTQSFHTQTITVDGYYLVNTRYEPINDSTE